MIYALITEKGNLSNQKITASTLSLSKKVVVFKSNKIPKLKGKLIQVFHEYLPPSGFRIDEINPDLYERAPGFEEIKAMISDKLFSSKKSNRVTFGISFYDFEYLQPSFVNALGSRIKRELKKQGIKADFVSVVKYPFLSKIKAKKLLNQGLEIVIIKKTVPPLSIYLGKVLKCC